MTRRQDAPSNAIERHTGDDDGDDIDGDNGNDEDDATDLGEIRLQCPRSEVAALVAGKHIPLPGMITNLQSATARHLTLQPAMRGCHLSARHAQPVTQLGAALQIHASRAAFGALT